MVLATADARLPTAVPFARVEVVRVSTIYIDCKGVQPKEKTTPKTKMKTIVVYAAPELPDSPSFEVPVIIAKQTEQNTMEYKRRGRLPILSVIRAPRRAATKHAIGLRLLISN